MFEKGHTKLPVQKVPEMARTLGADPAMLLRRAWREYDRKILTVVEAPLGDILAESEVE